MAGMSRKPRVEFAGALYHVIARGNRRAGIFHDKADYRKYLTRLRQCQERDGLTCYAYVLMNNHLHLLVESGKVPLSRTMQTLQFTYSQYYNRRYGKQGQVFQGRYKAILCDRDTYLLELVRYLHLNPARLRTPKSPWNYPWSSHAGYMGKTSTVRIETGVVLEQFHRQVGPARRAYHAFLREGVPQGHQPQFYKTVDQRFLGDKGFLNTVKRKADSIQAIGRKERLVSFPRVLRAVAETTGRTASSLVKVGRQRELVAPRAFLVYAARTWSALTMKDLGQRLNRDPSMMSRLYCTYLRNRRVAWEARVRRQISS